MPKPEAPQPPCLACALAQTVNNWCDAYEEHHGKFPTIRHVLDPFVETLAQVLLKSVPQPNRREVLAAVERCVLRCLDDGEAKEGSSGHVH